MQGVSSDKWMVFQMSHNKVRYHDGAATSAGGHTANRKLALCKPCAISLESGGTSLTYSRGGVNYKIMCDRCKRRRFGALYDVG